jgi:carboxyl-terminal processing protease
VRRALALLALAGAAYAADEPVPSAEPTPADARLLRALSVIEQNYLTSMTREALVERTLRVLLQDLDPYSFYLDEGEWDSRQAQVAAQFGGIGVMIEADSVAHVPRVRRLMFDSPAGAAGVREGDRIAAIDGQSTRNLDLDLVRSRLMGEPKRTVTVSVDRDGLDGSRDIAIERKPIKTPTVRGIRRDRHGRSEYLLDSERKVGYIRVMALAEDTAERVEAALVELERRDVRSLILDLRSSAGGLMQAAMAVADLFLDRGRILSDSSRVETIRYDAEPGTASDVPLAVLIDEWTASSSEFLAAALKDNGRGVFIGRRTYGKARIQSMFRLAEGEGGLILTRGIHVRPSGLAIDRHDAKEAPERAGVEPDPGMTIELDAEEIDRWWTATSLLDQPCFVDESEIAALAADRVLLAAQALLAGEGAQPSSAGEGPTPDGSVGVAPVRVPEGQLEEVLALVEREYVRPVSRDTLDLIGHTRTLEMLDPYSGYLDPAALAEFDRDLAGSFGGIGVRLDEAPTSERFRVLGPLIGSPALKAGIRAGDVLLAIDGTPVKGWTIEEMIGAAMGEPGSTVELTVRSLATGETRAVTIPRAVISVTTVRGVRCDPNGTWEYRLADGGAAYLRITGFSETTVADFDAALDAIEDEAVPGLVLDLRANLGGLTSAVADVADRLIDTGVIVTYRDRHEEERREATPGARLERPIVVLIDGDTISAGEILAAALQDHDRATIVGARTYGKGTVQNIFRLEDGGAVKLTIADYRRPSGAPIERHARWGDPERGGVWPDTGMAVAASDTQWVEWRRALIENDQRVILADGGSTDWPVPNDVALERALDALRSGVPR